MVHRGIADDAHLVYLIGLDGSPLADFGDKAVDAVDDCPVQLGQLLTGRAVCDPADNIIAELRLRIQGGGGCYCSGFGHIQQFGDDGGCADIHGQAEYRLLGLGDGVLSKDIGPDVDFGIDAVL